jgi:hypothetical protein
MSSIWIIGVGNIIRIKEPIYAPAKVVGIITHVNP